MKPFEMIQIQLRILSIYLQQNHLQFFGFNWKNWMIILLLIQHIISTASYLCIKANTFDEISEALFSMMSGILTIISYILFVNEKIRIFKLIDDLDKFSIKRVIQFQS